MLRRNAVLTFAALCLGCSPGDDLGRSAQLAALDVIGKAALERMSQGGHGGFHAIPVERIAIADGVWQARGVANTQLVDTGEGVVLFDTGLALQVPEQRELLREVAPGPVTHIILSHSHADHIGGWKFWNEEGTETITHREFEEEQRYLMQLEPFQFQRNRGLFPWMPESPPSIGLLQYGGVVPNRTVGEQDYAFTQGGVRFEVLSTPGAEGADNICLWLPDQKILFTGDTLGPNFPQFPNVFTARGEKIRKPIEYIHSLDKLIALEAEVLVPSHREHVEGVERIREGLTRIRDATRHVHDETVRGMNEGKPVHALMAEIALPDHLALTQEHGRVSWAVRSIYEYYATWFHWESATELYTVPVRAVYDDVAELAGSEALVARAREHLAAGRDMEALHLAEMVLGREAEHEDALAVARAAIGERLAYAEQVTHNNYEIDLLNMFLKRVGGGAAVE